MIYLVSKYITRSVAVIFTDVDGMLRRTARQRYRTTLDMKSAYEQIRIIPEHVSRSTVTTPDGNMVSNVIEIAMRQLLIRRL
jgi:hypothetical protein